MKYQRGFATLLAVYVVLGIIVGFTGLAIGTHENLAQEVGLSVDK